METDDELVTMTLLPDVIVAVTGQVVRVVKTLAFVSFGSRYSEGRSYISVVTTSWVVGDGEEEGKPEDPELDAGSVTGADEAGADEVGVNEAGADEAGADEAGALDGTDEVSGAEDDGTMLEDNTGTLEDFEGDNGTTLDDKTAKVVEEEYGVVEGISEVIGELEATAEEETGAVVDGAIHFVQTVDVIVLRIVEVERVVTVEVLPAEVCVSVTGQVVRVVTTLFWD